MSNTKELRAKVANQFLHTRNVTSMGRSESISNVIALIERRELEAKIDEAQKVYINYIPTGTAVARAVRQRIRRYKKRLEEL